jgi:hypothetical protein
MCSIQLKTLDGSVILATAGSWDPSINKNLVDSNSEGGIYVDRCLIPANFLNDTSYVLDVILLSNYSLYHASISDVITFKAEEGKRAPEFGDYSGSIIGLVRPSLKWTNEQLN